MSQTTEEVVSKTPERWRVLESEETAIPLVARFARCRFLQHEIGCGNSDRCKLEHKKGDTS